MEPSAFSVIDPLTIKTKSMEQIKLSVMDILDDKKWLSHKPDAWRQTADAGVKSEE